MTSNEILDQKTLLQDGDVSKGQDELIFDPFNPNNTEITQKQVEAILAKYGVPDKVHNFNLYKRAFIHKSYVKRPHLENEANGVTIVDQPTDCMNEGFMTEKKIALVKNESIGKMVYEMGLNKWYIMSKNAEEKKTRTNLKKLGCLFEAFLGALFLDFNKITIKDEGDWFKNVFVTGPGFQIAQIFVEYKMMTIIKIFYKFLFKKSLKLHRYMWKFLLTMTTKGIIWAFIFV